MRKADSETIRKRSKEQIVKLMENRHRLLAPFPVEPFDLNQLFYTKEQWEAINTLRSIDGLVKHDPWMYLVGVPVDGKHVKLMIKFEPPLPLGDDDTLSFVNLPSQMKEALAEWAVRSAKMQRDTIEITAKVDQLARCCNTFGQMVRVWPELQGFLTDGARYQVDNAKARSRYPEDVLKWDPHQRNARALKEEFMPKAYERYNTMLAEALMLPFVEGEFIATIVG